MVNKAEKETKYPSKFFPSSDYQVKTYVLWITSVWF